jgi:hypothetical protein
MTWLHTRRHTGGPISINLDTVSYVEANGDGKARLYWTTIPRSEVTVAETYTFVASLLTNADRNGRAPS